MTTRGILAGSATPVAITNVSVPDSSDSTTTTSALVVEQQVYSDVNTGELQGTVNNSTPIQMPNIPCKLVKFKARNDNAGNVYIGKGGVTVPNGSTDTTTGFELDSGEETGWIPVDNLNRFYRVTDNAGDDLTYLAVG